MYIDESADENAVKTSKGVKQIEFNSYGLKLEYHLVQVLGGWEISWKKM